MDEQEIIEAEIDRQIKQEKEEYISGDEIIAELKKEQKEMNRILSKNVKTGIFSYFTNEEYLYE